MTQKEKDETFQAYVDYAIRIYSDMIPYDDPEYEDKVLQLATSYADMEINGYPPKVLDVCKLHDKMLERRELDDYYGTVRDENGNIINGLTKDELPF